MINETHELRRLESASRLAAGMAHDFINRLAVIQLVTQRLLRERGDDGELARQLQRIQVSGGHAARETRRLMQVARGEGGGSAEVDLEGVIQSLAPLLRRGLPANVTLELALSKQAPMVRVDPNQLELLVVGLVLDARDAIGDGGRLLLELTGDGPSVDAAPVTGAPQVRLRIRSIPTQRANRTPASPHVPLGRETAASLAMEVGGSLQVRDSAAAAYDVEIRLPSRSAESLASASVAPDPLATIEASELLPLGRGEAVLVVEEDPLLRDVLSEELGTAGYQAHTAADALQAVQHVDELDDEAHPRLLVTEVVLPGGLSGPQLAQRLRTRVPALQVVYQSGSSAERASTDPAWQGGMVLRKPFTARQLLRAAHRALHTTAS